MRTITELGKGRQKKRIWDEKTAGVDVEALWLQKDRKDLKRVHLAGLGDVGRNVALGLTLLGDEVVGRIGLYDLHEAQCKRMEIELSQMAPPPGGEADAGGDDGFLG